MRDIKVTVASLRSDLIDPQANLERVRQAAAKAEQDGARILFLPELMLTGHGGHPSMVASAESIPDGPLSSAVVELSKKHQLCICVGIAELAHGIVYNAQMVADRGEYLGLQRKVHMSGDEYLFFGTGEAAPCFDIGDIRFGINICYDNHFPELALVHALNNVDLILAPHAARTGEWPAEPDTEFKKKIMKRCQDAWARVHQARAMDHNVFVLVNNAVGPSTTGLEGVIANHGGTVMGVLPGGDIFLRSDNDDIVDEVVTVELLAEKRKRNHAPARNRRAQGSLRMLEDAVLNHLADRS